jgi:hypothetical protein
MEFGLPAPAADVAQPEKNKGRKSGDDRARFRALIRPVSV